ncbi:MAG TPA: hypothetical protein VMZ53_25330 [Kofleriaceae bacterium]|nr:hypothetical protein [Kofleriaceae bacterium]
MNWWFAPAPEGRLRALRILIGGYALVYLVARMPEIYKVAHYGREHFAQVGVTRLLDAPLAPALVLAIAIATCALLACLVANVQYRITAPLAALGLLWTITYRNSWGMVFHTENLLVLHVIALALSPPKGDAGWPVKLMATLTTLTYLLAGIAKLRIAGPAWIDGELLRNQIAVDNLRKALLGDPTAPLANLFLHHPKQLVVFSAMTLVIELGAPLALLHRRIGYVWAVTAWAFHLGVVLLMNIWFPYPLLGFAFLPLLPAERLIARATTLVVMLRKRSS